MDYSKDDFAICLGQFYKPGPARAFQCVSLPLDVPSSTFRFLESLRCQQSSLNLQGLLPKIRTFKYDSHSLPGPSIKAPVGYQPDLPASSSTLLVSFLVGSTGDPSGKT